MFGARKREAALERTLAEAAKDLARLGAELDDANGRAARWEDRFWRAETAIEQNARYLAEAEAEVERLRAGILDLAGLCGDLRVRDELLALANGTDPAAEVRETT